MARHGEVHEAAGRQPVSGGHPHPALPWESGRGWAHAFEQRTAEEQERELERLAQRMLRLNVTEPSLAGLSADVHAAIWSWLLPSHLPSALALMKTCSSLRVQLEPLRAKEVVHRLVWLPEMSMNVRIMNAGRSLAPTQMQHSWACCGPLPSTGRHTWFVHFDRYPGPDASFLVGVCRADGHSARGLCGDDGTLMGATRHHGNWADPWPSSSGTKVCTPLFNRDCQQIMFDAQGRGASLRGSAQGCVVQVIWDSDTRTLSIFGVNVNRAFAPELSTHIDGVVDLVHPWIHFAASGAQVTISPLYACRY